MMPVFINTKLKVQERFLGRHILYQIIHDYPKDAPSPSNLQVNSIGSQRHLRNTR